MTDGLIVKVVATAQLYLIFNFFQYPLIEMP